MKKKMQHKETFLRGTYVELHISHKGEGIVYIYNGQWYSILFDTLGGRSTSARATRELAVEHVKKYLN